MTLSRRAARTGSASSGSSARGSAFASPSASAAAQPLAELFPFEVHADGSVTPAEFSFVPPSK